MERGQRRRRRYRRAWQAAVVGVAAASAGRSARGDLYLWRNVDTGDLTWAGNWVGGAVPGGGDIGQISNYGTATVDGSSDPAHVFGELRIGDGSGDGGQSGFGLLQQSGGTLNVSSWLVVGRFTGGEYDLSGNSVLYKSGAGTRFLIEGGNGQAGIVRMSGSSSVVMNGGDFFDIGDPGYVADASGQMYMTDNATFVTNTTALVRNGLLSLAGNASFNASTNSPAFGINPSIGFANDNGTDDRGTLTLADHATAYFSNALTVGWHAGSQGIVNVGTGAAGESPTLYVGQLILGRQDTAAGTVNQLSGTVQEIAGITGDWEVGGDAGTTSRGTYNLSGGTLNVASSNVFVGSRATGVMNVTGGTFNEGVFLSIGRYSGAIGVMNVSGGTVNLGSGFRAVVGEQGNGTLLLSGTGTVNTPSLVIAQDYGTTAGLVQQTGGTMNAPSGVQFGVATGGTGARVGTYNLSGGTLITGTVSSPAAALTDLTSTLNLNGGTLQAASSSATFISSISAANVLAGGATFNTSGFSVTVPQPLLHGGTSTDGGLTKVGAGTLALAGVNTFNGGVRVDGGTLLAMAASQSLGTGPANVTGGVLGGTGSTGTGLVTLGTGGTITAGTGATLADAVGTLSLGGGLNLSGGSFVVKLDLANGKADRLVISGLTSANGSGVQLTVRPIALSASPAANQPYQFTIASAAASTFTSLMGRIALASTTDNLGDTLSLSASNDGSLLLLNVVAAAPEPTSLLLVAVGALPLLGRRRRGGVEYAAR